MSGKPKVAVLVGTKGRGSNMANLIQAGRDGRMNAEVSLVVSPKPNTPAVAKAQKLNTPVKVHGYKDASYAQDLLATLQSHQIDLVCLAGYMTLLPKLVLDQFPQRVLNIHPALLPKFGGKGMYGLHVHRAVLEAGEATTGCTVHYVTEEYDEGDPIACLKVKVLKSDTPESLAARVNEAEMRAYPRAVNRAVKNL